MERIDENLIVEIQPTQDQTVVVHDQRALRCHDGELLVVARRDVGVRDDVHGHGGQTAASRVVDVKRARHLVRRLNVSVADGRQVLCTEQVEEDRERQRTEAIQQAAVDSIVRTRFQRAAANATFNRLNIA